MPKRTDISSILAVAGLCCASLATQACAQGESMRQPNAQPSENFTQQDADAISARCGVSSEAIRVTKDGVLLFPGYKASEAEFACVLNNIRKAGVQTIAFLGNEVSNEKHN